MKNSMKILMSMLLFVLIFGIGQVHAIPYLTITDGMTTQTITDGDMADKSAIIGKVSVTDLVIGNFTLDVTGFTKPWYGTADYPKMHVNSVAVSSVSGGTATITFVEDNYGPLLPGVTGFYTDTAVWSDGTVKVSTYLTDIINTTTLASFDHPGNYLDDATTAVSPVDPFTLTTVIEINHDAGMTSSLDVNIDPIPEPGTLMLLGSGLAGVGFYTRRKKK